MDEYIKQFKQNVCRNCKASCDKGINISSWNGKTLLRCIDYKQKENDKSYSVSHLYEEQ